MGTRQSTDSSVMSSSNWLYSLNDYIRQASYAVSPRSEDKCTQWFQEQRHELKHTRGASIVLSLRSLVLTKGKWEQFWEKLDRYGFPVEA